MAFLASLKVKPFLLAIVTVAALVCQPRAVQSSDALQLNEQSIKAGLVYNFLKYTSWPSDSPIKNGRLNVCLFGLDPLESYLSSLQGQTAQQAVISLTRKYETADTANCSMIFIDSGEKENLPELLSFLKTRHVLTISDMDQFAHMGGMVELAMADKRVALFINKKAVEVAGLNIQSRLLNLAKQIPE